MALPSSYTSSYSTLPEFFGKIRDAQAPDRFTNQILKDLGYKSNNHRPFIPLMKALGFLSADGSPTQRDQEYRNHALSERIMGEAIKEAYSDLFLIKSKPTTKDNDLITGKFKSYHNVSDTVANLMSKTFFSLLKIADLDYNQKQLLAEALAPFGIARRNNALEMARLYAVINCFENEIRDFIRETLTENEGIDWWNNLQRKTKEHAENRQRTALTDSWLEGEKTDLLGFVDFGMLASIMIEKWTCFSNLVPSQHWLKQRMEELEKARNFIAHNRMLLPSEFQRIYMYVADWNRVIGL